MQSHSRGSEIRLAIGFFVASILFITIGALLWPRPMGMLTIIIGFGGCGIAVLQAIGVRPASRRLRDPELLVNPLRADQPSNTVFLAPVLGGLALVVIWVIEILVLLAKLCSGGNWPAAAKCWVVTGLTIVATIYKLTLWKQHRIYHQQSPVLNHTQSWVVIGLVVCYLVFCGWLLTPLPLRDSGRSDVVAAHNSSANSSASRSS